MVYEQLFQNERYRSLPLIFNSLYKRRPSQKLIRAVLENSVVTLGVVQQHYVYPSAVEGTIRAITLRLKSIEYRNKGPIDSVASTLNTVFNTERFKTMDFSPHGFALGCVYEEIDYVGSMNFITYKAEYKTGIEGQWKPFQLLIPNGPDSLVDEIIKLIYKTNNYTSIAPYAKLRPVSQVDPATPARIIAPVNPPFSEKGIYQHVSDEQLHVLLALFPHSGLRTEARRRKIT